MSPPLGSAHEPRLADGERREVVVVHVPLALLHAQVVEHLLHPQHAQGGDVEHLGLAPLEETRAVGALHGAHLDGDRPDPVRRAPVQAHSLVDHSFPHGGFESLLEGLLGLGGEFGIIGSTAATASSRNRRSRAARSRRSAVLTSSSSPDRTAFSTWSITSGE